jgi:hypothetical protein
LHQLEKFMHGYAQWAALAVGVMISLTSHAQVPAGAPVGATGLCKDGSYYSGPTTQGACDQHGGVKEWYGAKAPTPAAPAAASATTPNKTADTTAATRRKSGFGQVWVNPLSKVYYCPGAGAYGTTKDGEYMTEFDAKAAGNHADQGKACY